MIMTVAMSSLRGTATTSLSGRRALHQLPELGEQVPGVVGTGAGLRVVLPAEGGHDLDGRHAVEVTEDGALDAEVVGDDPQWAVSVPVRPVGGDGGDEVDPLGARLGGGRRPERGLAGGAERARHGPGLPDVAGEAA